MNKFFLILFAILICESNQNILEKWDALCDVKSNFNDCGKIATQQVIRKLDKDYKELGLFSLKPLKIPFFIPIGQNPESGISLNYTNTENYGFNEADVEYFNWNFDKKVLEMKLRIYNYTCVGSYNLQGKILAFVLEGIGPFKTVVKNFVWHDIIEFEPEYEIRDGKHYLKIKSLKLIMLLEPENISFQYYNLFNNKDISDAMNKALAESIVDLYAELEEPITRGYEGIHRKYFDTFFDKLPVEYMLKNLPL